MTEPLKLACHCGFVAETAQAFLDHAMETQHIEFGGDAESGDLASLLAMIEMIQAHATAEARGGPPIELPEGAEINRISEADILADDELSDEAKADLLDWMRKKDE